MAKFETGDQFSTGRAPGARNKLQGDFVAAYAKDFAENGEGVIRIVRIEKPVEYLKIGAAMLPREFHHVDATLDDVTDDELREYIERIRAEKARRAGSP